MSRYSFQMQNHRDCESWKDASDEELMAIIPHNVGVVENELGEYYLVSFKKFLGFKYQRRIYEKCIDFAGRTFMWPKTYQSKREIICTLLAQKSIEENIFLENKIRRVIRK